MDPIPERQRKFQDDSCASDLKSNPSQLEQKAKELQGGAVCRKSESKREELQGAGTPHDTYVLT